MHSSNLFIPENAVLVPEGSSLCYVLSTEDGEIFHKIHLPQVKPAIKKMVRTIDKLAMGCLPFHEHFEVLAPSSELTEKEIRTLKIWTENGIITPRIIYQGNTDIKLEYIPGQTMRRTLQKNPNDESYSQFLELYSRIRAIAKKNRNIYALHSDPHLGNFYLDERRGLVLPIDPGWPIKEDSNFDDVDSTLVMFTLESIHKMNINKEDKIRLYKEFGRILSNEDIERVSKKNLEVPKSIAAYINLRCFVRNLVKKDYKKEETVQRYRRFKEDFEEYILDTLRKR